MLCLESVILQYHEVFYKQTSGIVTGDNHSVLLANIALHYVILPISHLLSETIIFKCFIDDIPYLFKYNAHLYF